MYNKRFWKNKFIVLTAVFMMTTSMLVFTNSANADEQLIIPCNFDLDIGVYPSSNGATPTGSSYKLYDYHGGTWYDAEKTIEDGDDDLMCWAAAASNVLKWTGWGYVVHSTEGDMTTEDEMFEHFNDHWEDQGGLSHIGWEWWFAGTVPSDYPNDPPYNGGPADWSEVNVPGGGDFWAPTYDWTNYVHSDMWTSDEMEKIDEYLHNGWGVALGVYNGGHAITCWGFNYDPDVDKNTDPEDYYLGVWVTDSDDDKENQPDYPDSIRYYEVEYSGGHWYLQDFYETSAWYIDYVFGLEPFPNTAPTADAGGPYTGFEGSNVNFDGSSSSDPDGNPLQYRWDFDNNGVYDTEWSSSPTATYKWNDDFSGNVKLQVSDYMDTDIDTDSVLINNVAPTITSLIGDTTSEDGTATVSGTFSDPGTLDTFTITIGWGEGTPESFSYPAGSTSFSETHQYLDDNPTGTSQDDYTVSVTVTDDDGGVDSDTGTITVYNVDPEVSIDNMSQPNPQFILPLIHELNFTGSYTDVGTLDTHIIHWSFGDGDTQTGTLHPSHIYDNPGTYTVTLTVTDDDTGVGTDTYEVEVVDEFGALQDLDDYIQNLPDECFKGKPILRKWALHMMLSEIYLKLVDMDYISAIQDLRNNIREKADGKIDGKPGNDWILNLTAQQHICMKIDDLTSYLELVYLPTNSISQFNFRATFIHFIWKQLALFIEIL